ncbi:MAG TPA: hypothetical protein V6D48_04620, partial [Oculatellaceae cyanobacterium]
MNISDGSQDLASLVSRIEQLEERLYIVAKYAVRVKHQLDGLTQKFNNRPELEQIESLQVAIVLLAEKL